MYKLLEIHAQQCSQHTFPQMPWILVQNALLSAIINIIKRIINALCKKWWCWKLYKDLKKLILNQYYWLIINQNRWNRTLTWSITSTNFVSKICFTSKLLRLQGIPHIRSKSVGSKHPRPGPSCIKDIPMRRPDSWYLFSSSNFRLWLKNLWSSGPSKSPEWLLISWMTSLEKQQQQQKTIN